MTPDDQPGSTSKTPEENFDEGDFYILVTPRIEHIVDDAIETLREVQPNVEDAGIFYGHATGMYMHLRFNRSQAQVNSCNEGGLSPAFLTGARLCPRDQPVPFSHTRHVGGLGIDCQLNRHRTHASYDGAHDSTPP